MNFLTTTFFIKWDSTIFNYSKVKKKKNQNTKTLKVKSGNICF